MAYMDDGFLPDDYEKRRISHLEGMQQPWTLEQALSVFGPIKPIQKPTLLPTDPAERKRVPIWSGVLQYFPDAIVEIAKVSYAGNEQHNPGEPLHWAREKSTDQEDTILRHLMESGKRDTDGQLHTAKAAWRILAKLQLELERGKNANQVNSAG